MTPVAARRRDVEWEVVALYTYPVKSCRPVLLDASQVGETGLDYDRLWMVVDAKTGRFVTQRQVPRLALVSVTINRTQQLLELSAATMPTTLRLPLHPEPGQGERHRTRVWYDTVAGRCCGADAARWLSEFVGKPARLLYKDPQEPRLVSRYVPAGCDAPPQSGYADVFPFHITTDPSLQDVNQHVPRPLTHQHFRPNIVLAPVHPAMPYDEETWKRLEFVGSGPAWSMFVTSRTPRCTMPNVDLASGEMQADGEPLKSLRRFRCVDPGQPKFPCFGMQAAPQRTRETVHLGQRVVVRERGLHSLTEPL
ncbi:hypothetical protein GGF46_000582 [Coemansia sp. RSA 552]|nr:hypothetical protein GGF46_000582 [Coemansia sp. RSA 552]